MIWCLANFYPGFLKPLQYFCPHSCPPRVTSSSCSLWHISMIIFWPLIGQRSCISTPHWPKYTAGILWSDSWRQNLFLSLKRKGLVIKGVCMFILNEDFCLPRDVFLSVQAYDSSSEQQSWQLLDEWESKKAKLCYKFKFSTTLFIEEKPQPVFVDKELLIDPNCLYFLNLLLLFCLSTDLMQESIV